MALNLPNVYRVAIDYTQGGLPMTNVHHVFSEVVDEDAIANSVGTRWCNAFDNMIADDVQWSKARSQELVPNSLEYEASLTGIGGGVGQYSGTPCPPGVACVIKWTTAQGGRSGRGRSYIGGCPVEGMATTEASWSATFLGIADSAASNFINNLQTDDTPLVIVSRTLEEYYAVLLGSAQSAFGSQRRRNVA